ncbi:MAG TPA: histidine kinase [Verrucomicrobiae bacterium]|jgi:signal transduction histidine kinase|nr:histidine kinase [Verrucomicrobiae bacterium]
MILLAFVMIRVGKARPNPALRLVKTICSLPVFAVLFSQATTFATPANISTDTVLTNGSQVLSLSADDAQKGVSVYVTGVVTSAEPSWGGRFFVQDSTGGVFVENISEHQPQPGDVVQVSGVSHPGAFAPIITKPRWEKIGVAPLPPAKDVRIEQVMAGVEDGQRVEVTGVVRDVEIGTDRLEITLASGGYRMRAYLPVPPGINANSLIGDTVHARGTAAASYNAKLRHLIRVILYVPQVSDFIVEKSELTNPFNDPILPLNNIAQYRKDGTPGTRVHVKGVVTFQRLGQDVFLNDGNGGLHVKSHDTNVFAVGDVIEAVGFPDLENFLPVLEDAVFQKTDEPRQIPEPRAVSVAQVQAGLHHAEFMAIRGNVLDRNVRLIPQPRGGPSRYKTILLLQSENLSFTAEAETSTEESQLSTIPIGGRIEVSGICLTESGDDGRFKSLQVLLPTDTSFRVLSKPSLLTPRNLGIALSIFSMVAVAAIIWTIVISRKNAELSELVHEKEKAKIELQNAHDQLEVRVKERSEQLKIQIAARKESELQFKGGLAERTRLAQELHDTLEQTLASIALQLDTTAKLFHKDLDAASYHFELARNILAQSQVDVRRSVWDLRSRALEQFDLRGALIASCKQITDGTQIHAEVKAVGRVRPLPEIIEDNLLRIAQEALTNVIKHSGASEIEISLDYGPQTVALEIEDNGRGFSVDDCVGPREGHFGLLGMSERAQRLRGKVMINSAPGSGTNIRVEIPITVAQELQWSETAELRS